MKPIPVQFFDPLERRTQPSGRLTRIHFQRASNFKRHTGLESDSRMLTAFKILLRSSGTVVPIFETNPRTDQSSKRRQPMKSLNLSLPWRQLFATALLLAACAQPSFAQPFFLPINLGKIDVDLTLNLSGPEATWFTVAEEASQGGPFLSPPMYPITIRSPVSNCNAASSRPRSSYPVGTIPAQFNRLPTSSPADRLHPINASRVRTRADLLR